MTGLHRFRVNGRAVEVDAPPASRLTRVLRDRLGLTGTKVGCDAGDCGACTVLLDGEQVCACLVSLGQVAGRSITTVEGLTENGGLSRLQRAFHAHGAAQCGICTPGMLMAASTLLGLPRPPTEPEVLDALGGVLCRCTGYRKIVRAVLAATNGESSAAGGAEAHTLRGSHAVTGEAESEDPQRPYSNRGNTPVVGLASPGDHAPEANVAATDASTSTARYVGRRLPSVDGVEKVTGRAVFGADEAPDGALRLRVVRSPHPHARFTLGDCTALHARHPGLARILTAADVPGVNGFGIYPDIKDQPVLAPGVARYRGEAVAALVGDDDTIDRIADDEIPIDWEPLPALRDPREAVAPGAEAVQPAHPDNVLTRGRVHAGTVPPAGCDELVEASDELVEASDELVEASGEFETPFIEHAYIEPEAGYARRIEGDRIEVSACTQTPYMDRDEVANVLGIAPERVRIRPSACGGGFGGKLDQSVQPLVALAAWLLGVPVRCTFTRIESMTATTKRHPSRIRARAVADADGHLVAYEFDSDFDTGAYASWGPTVAGRVPVHCMGPYRVPNVRADSRAILTNSPPSGAFRGFGVPQAAIAHESLVDELAVALGLDPLEFRHRNALLAGDRTATGQVLGASVGLVACLDALRPRWKALREEAEAFNAWKEAEERKCHGAGSGTAAEKHECGEAGSRTAAERHERVEVRSRTTAEGHERSEAESRTTAEGHERSEAESRTTAEGHERSEAESRTTAEGHERSEAESRTTAERYVRSEAESGTTAERYVRNDARIGPAGTGRRRRGVGVACMWYGCGNTSMSNPSSMRVTLSRDGRVLFRNGAQDIGQGSSTIMLQIMAEALGLPMERIDMVVSDTDLTEDAGKSSASRQTFVSGRAAQMAGADLRAKMLALANAGADAVIRLDGGELGITGRDGVEHAIALGRLPVVAGDDIVLEGRGYFDPPSTPLDENGQGTPYATYGFAAQVASVEVDLELGTVTPLRIVAAHDVGAAVNPTLVEGQIEGGIAQGIGLALMEEYVPGRTENLHDYLFPTIGDVPEIECLLVEDPEPLGPYGAKGIGEPALIPTAPAILNAVYHAAGVRLRRLPILPHRVREAIEAGGSDG